MVALSFSVALVLVALNCAFKIIARWRSPDSWHLDGETKKLTFHRWLDLGLFASVGGLCLIFALLPFAF